MRTHEVIKSCRTLAGVTQGDLAKRTGISRPVICQFENGKRVPKCDDLEIILNALGYQLVIAKAKTRKVYRPFKELKACVDHINVTDIAESLKEGSLNEWCSGVRSELNSLITAIESGGK